MRKIAVVTATRAEYGLLKNLIALIEQDRELALQLIVTGAHLCEEFGNTYKEIEKDFKISKKIPMDLSSDTSVDISKSMAELQINMSQTFADLQPDILLILGDRYEILSVATSAMMLNIPIAHIHGGETTEGAIDEAIRHAITKMSHLHFCATELYRKRVIQLGENPNRVFNIGSLGVENITKEKSISKEEFEASINFRLAKKNLLVTYHPTTLEKHSVQEQFKELLNALDVLKETHIIFTKTNADRDGKIINTMIEKYVFKHPKSSIVFASLGQERYFHALKHVDAVLGNSSSGIIEAPSFKIATINIGNRQKGREQATSIINVKAEKNAISHAIESIYTEEFQSILQESKNPYQAKDTSQSIKESLNNTSLDNILKKSFFDIRNPHGRVLVIAVHPDDETLGCGGTLLKHKAEGDEVHWLICTDTKNFDFQQIRTKEIKKVAQRYQFDSTTKLKLTTTKLDEYSINSLIEKISKVINSLKPNIIYLPFRSDVHSDHRIIFEAAYSCTKSFRYPFIEKIYMMETLSETEFAPAFEENVFIANVFVNIENYIEEKIKIMQLYESELQDAPFPRSRENIKALATFRGSSCGCKYAESFMLLKDIYK